jgi:mono/diheme cytochrome c family protein
MRLNSNALFSVLLGGATIALTSGCSSQDPSSLTSDPQATTEELRRHCELEQDDEDEVWRSRCQAYNEEHHRDAGAPAHPGSDAGSKDAGSAPAPPPTTPAPPPTTPPTTTPPPVPAPTTCASFTYSAWGACASTGKQTRTEVSASPAGCTGGAPVLSQACTYTAPIDGAALYASDCAGCHGNSKKGKSASSIQSAISGNVGGMGSLSGLTAAQIAAISAAP